MKKFFLLTAYGKDRPGIVAGVSQAIFEAGGNIEDASMTRLGGEFAMMLVTSLPAGPAEKKALKTLQPLIKRLGLELALKPIHAGLSRATARDDQPRLLISVYGTDRPGIVHRVAKSLADRKVNITDLNTRASHRDGKPVYVMLLEVQAPAELDLDDLRTELDQLRGELNVEITLQDIDAVAL